MAQEVELKVTHLSRNRPMLYVISGLALIFVIVILVTVFTPAAANEPTVNRAGAKAAAAADGLSISPSQAKAFSDDIITDQERKDAFNAWIACIESAGFDVVESELRYFGESIAIDDPNDASSPFVDSCRETHYQAIAIAHRATLEVPEQTAEQIEQEINRCKNTPEASRVLSASNDEAFSEAFCRRTATDMVLGRP